MGAFADIVRAGKAHYIGVSEWTVEEIRAGAALAAELGIQFVSSQPQYNMLWRVIEPEVVPVCEELGITQVCWSPLAQGVLSGKYGASTVPAGSRFSADDGGLKTEHKFMQPEVLERVEKLKPIADDLGVPLATLAVAWVLANPNVSAAIVGASRPEQLDDTVKAAELVLGQETLNDRRCPWRRRGARPRQGGILPPARLGRDRQNRASARIDAGLIGQTQQNLP